MFNIYDKTKNIIFMNNDRSISFPHPVNLADYEDYFIIETQISLGDITRGWVGDVKITLSGIDCCQLNNPQERVEEEIVYKDALCCRRIFDMDDDTVAIWKYTFNKY